MTTTTATCRDAAERLRSAAETGIPCAPVRDLIGSDDVATAYAVQTRLISARRAAGARIVGRKIGLTSRAVQGAIGDGRRRSGLVDLEDTDGQMTRWLRRHRIHAGDVLVLRPDKYVFGAGPDGAAVTAALCRQLGLGALTDRAPQREVAV